MPRVTLPICLRPVLAAAANHNGLDGFGHWAQLLGTFLEYQSANPLVNSIFGNFEELLEIAFSLTLLKNNLPKNQYSPPPGVPSLKYAYELSLRALRVLPRKDDLSGRRRKLSATLIGIGADSPHGPRPDPGFAGRFFGGGVLDFRPDCYPQTGPHFTHLH